MGIPRTRRKVKLDSSSLALPVARSAAARDGVAAVHDRPYAVVTLHDGKRPPRLSVMRFVDATKGVAMLTACAEDESAAFGAVTDPTTADLTPLRPCCSD